MKTNKTIIKIISIIFLAFSILGILQVIGMFFTNFGIFAMGGHPLSAFKYLGFYVSFLFFAKLFKDIFLLYGSVQLMRFKRKAVMAINISFAINILLFIITLINSKSDFQIRLSLIIEPLILIAMIVYINKKETKEILN